MIQPEAIVLGGGVSNYYDRFEKYLHEDLERFSTPLTPLPMITKAERPDEAVVFGCYHLAKSYAKSRHKVTA